MGKKKKQKDRFELWRDRLFSIIVPFFFGYLLLTQIHNTTIKIILLVLLLGFATGEAALFGRHIIHFINKGISGIDQEEKKDKQDKQDKQDRKDKQDNYRKTNKIRDNKEDGAG